MCGVCGMHVDWRYYRHNLTTISRSFDLDHWHKSAARLRLFTRRHIEFYTHDTRRPVLKTKENTCEDCPRLSSRLWTYVANIYCEHHEYLDTYDEVSLNISTTCNVPHENKQGSFLIYTSGLKRSAVALSMLRINKIPVTLKKILFRNWKNPSATGERAPSDHTALVLLRLARRRTARYYFKRERWYAHRLLHRERMNK